jgi:small-conductance mechanosensitive channel/CRP-like cAMP-binding protein
MNDMLVFAAAAAAALAVYALILKVLAGLRGPANEAGVDFFRRVSLPALFLAAALGSKLAGAKKIVETSPRFGLYAEAAVLLFGAFLLVQLVDAWLLYRRQRKNLPPHLPGVLHGFLLFVIYVLVLFWVLKGKLGINISPLLTTSAIFTAIIGLAFQGVLSNVLAGISLNMTRSLGRGDWVRIGPHEGVVKEMNWRETQLLDRAANIVVIPNSSVASEMIVNYSRPNKDTLVSLPLKVGPQAPPAVVLEAACAAASEVPGVLKTPAPTAFIQSYEETGVTYLLRFWIADFAQKNVVAGEVAKHVWYRFKRLGIEIPVPVGERVGDIVKAMRPEAAAGRERAERELAFMDLAHSGLLRSQEGELLVPEAEVRLLAGRARRARYTAGEVLFRQGEPGRCCYVVAEGKVRGEIVYEEQGKRYASEFHIGPGGVVGEMSLFTGMPRTATCAVEEEAELIEIGEADFAFLLERNPGVAEVIAGLVSGRNKQNESFLRKIKELSEQDIAAVTDKGSILARLKRLMGFGR